MSDMVEIKELLIEIRENQRLSLQRQEEHLEIARTQIERSRDQVQESIELQRLAMDRFKRVSRFAIPAIIFCIALIIFLLVRFF